MRKTFIARFSYTGEMNSQRNMSGQTFDGSEDAKEFIRSLKQNAALFNCNDSKQLEFFVKLINDKMKRITVDLDHGSKEKIEQVLVALLKNLPSLTNHISSQLNR